MAPDNIDIISVSAPAGASLPASDAMSGGTETISSGPAAPSNGSDAPAKPRSGYARIRQRHHRLIEEHEKLKADFAELLGASSDANRHWKLMDQHKALRADFDALSEMYRQMEDALLENTQLLEQAVSRPVYPSSGAQSLFSRGAR